MSSLNNDLVFIELLSNNIPKRKNIEKNLLNSSLCETNSDEEFKNSSSTNITTIEENKRNSIYKDNVNIYFEKGEKKENNSFNEIKELNNENNYENKISEGSIETYALDDKINKSYFLK